MKRILLLLSLISLLGSCSLIGINLKRKAPRHAAKYPKFSQKDSIRGFLSAERDCYQPYYYELDIRFEPKEKKIAGKARIFLKANSNFKTILLNLNEEMKIESIVWNEQKLNYRRKYTGLWVDFPEEIFKDNKLVLEITYGGKPVIAKRPPWEGGFVWKKDEKKRDWVGVACEEVGANLWWPLKDHLTAEPDSMLMRYTVPKGLSCVANGRLLDQKDSDNESTFTWFVSYPINTYNVTFYIGKFEHFSTQYNKAENKRLNYFVLDYNLEKAQKHFKQTRKIMECYEKIYGEYPFWRDEYKLVESPFAGMEHQSAIAYGNGYKNNNYGIDYIILHETAHEWWGNAISVKDYADIWIHEGMATYSEALYIEKTFGYDAYANYLYFYSIMVKNKKPMVGPRDVNYWNYKDGDPYMKGALMMHSLRTTLNNDDLFFDIIRSFFQRYKYQTVTSADFINMVNEKTGKDYGWFFQKFLYDRKPPVLEYFIEDNEASGEQKIHYRWADADTNFVMPVLIKFSDGTKSRIIPGTQAKVSTFYGASLISIDTRSAYFTLREKKFKH